MTQQHPPATSLRESPLHEPIETSLSRPPLRPRNLLDRSEPTTLGGPPAAEVERRDVEPGDVAARLRGMLGLPPERPAWGEVAASLPRPMPPIVHDLDAAGWIAWCLAGLVLYGERSPSLAFVRRESKRVAIALAMLRANGNLSAAARRLGASRKVLRENLRAVGLHPWITQSNSDEPATSTPTLEPALE